MKPKHLLRAFLVTGFLLLLLFPAQGQITISKTDVANATAVGTTGTGYLTPFGTNPVVHIGPVSSAAQTWDFRSYSFDPFNTVEFIAPSAAPHLTSFPQTNVVLKQSDDASPTNVFQYNRLTDTEYLCLGTGNDSDTNLVVYNPPLPQLKIPMTLGTSWTYTGLPHSPYPGITTQNSCKYTVDAFGTLRLPVGDFQALRLRAEYLTDTRTSISSSLSKGLAYHFFTKNLDWVYVYADTNDIGKQDVQTTGIGYQVSSNTNAVESRHTSEQSFDLRNYPNPFSRQTTISFQLAASGHVTLKIYDALGRPVRTLVDGRENFGSHSVSYDASQLPAGLYFYRLTCGNGAMTGRAIVRR
jgi:hypothetical protein